MSECHRHDALIACRDGNEGSDGPQTNGKLVSLLLFCGAIRTVVPAQCFESAESKWRTDDLEMGEMLKNTE